MAKELNLLAHPHPEQDPSIMEGLDPNAEVIRAPWETPAKSKKAAPPEPEKPAGLVVPPTKEDMERREAETEKLQEVAAADASRSTSWGAVISIVLILALIIVGAFYSWGQRIAVQHPEAVQAQ